MWRDPAGGFQALAEQKREEAQMTEPKKPTLREQFDADAAALDEQFRQFYTPEIADSFRRCVEGEYDPPDAKWRQP